MNDGSQQRATFRLQAGYDQLELLGARWWQESMAWSGPARAAGTLESRRDALRSIFVFGGMFTIAGIAVMASTRRSGGTGPYQLPPRKSLDLQREQGLATRASDHHFAYLGEVHTTADGAALDLAWLRTLGVDLMPRAERWRPYHLPTLFQACTNGPDAAEFAAGLRLIDTPAMRAAHAQGLAVRELLEHAENVDQLLLVVDLDGPESVAFAAALQPRATAVFTFDNWPHPRGVVPSHRTLAAVVCHRAAFLANDGSGAQPAVFVLDRARLAPDVAWDASGAAPDDRFDNRYVARLPTAAALQQLGIRRVLYVVPSGADAKELDDLNEPFCGYRDAGIAVGMVGLGDFTLGTVSAAAPTPRYYWHGSPATHWWFWHHFAWASRSTGVEPTQPTTTSFGADYSPLRRRTIFDGTMHFGMAPDRRGGAAAGGGSGSWSRSNGGYSGG